ncbi:hypothetical protein IFM47457_01934 [Aspergillus lentulus]|nr:hypothetical protein IFM47457_01934 [Aspergillus lentulus]
MSGHPAEDLAGIDTELHQLQSITTSNGEQARQKKTPKKIYKEDIPQIRAWACQTGSHFAGEKQSSSISQDRRITMQDKTIIKPTDTASLSGAVLNSKLR